MNKVNDGVPVDAQVSVDVAQVYDQWIAAAVSQNVEDIMQLYTDDVVAYDAVLALRFEGKSAYREHWQRCMELCPSDGKQPVFRLRDLQVHSAGDLALAHGLLLCGHTDDAGHAETAWMRVTTGMRREQGRWRIFHEHFSSPFDMPSGKAMFHLQPDQPEGQVRPIPSGMASVTPHIVCKDAPAAIEFYKKAFGARELPGGILELDGVFLHGEIVIGDSIIMISQEDERCGSVSPLTLKGTPVSLHVYVEDVDQAFRRAIEAGANELMPVTDMFWGDRFCVVADPYGHHWSLATHVRDLTPAQIQDAARQFCQP